MNNLWCIWVWLLTGSILWINLSTEEQVKVNNNCNYSEEILWVKLEYCFQVWEALKTKYTISWVEPNWYKQEIASFDFSWPIILDRSKQYITRCFINWIDRYVTNDWKIIKPEDIIKNPELEKIVQQFWINPDYIKKCIWFN